MTDPTFTRATAFPSGAFFITFYNTQMESRDKESNLFVHSLPRSDSTSTIALDLLGVTGNWTITGVVVSPTVVLTTWLKDLDALVNGTQTSGTYTIQSLGLSRTMKVDSVTYSYKAGEASSVNYTVKLIETSS